MEYEITIEQLEPQRAAVIVETVAREQIGEFIGGAYQELYPALAGPPLGPPFARYRMLDDGFEVTAGVPVASDQPPVGRVRAGLLPGGPAAVTMHVGSYDELPGAYEAVSTWVRESGRQVASDPWEAYLDGPEVAEPRTQVFFPLTQVS